VELDEEVREFLIESNENLGNLDREIVLLEEHPKDAALIASVFRTIHTIKGTCGFFGFNILGAITHVAENILHQVRAGQRDLTAELISLILEAVDAVKAVIAVIESTGTEGTNEYLDIRERLTHAHENIQDAATAPTSANVPETISNPPTPTSPVPGIAAKTPALPVPVIEENQVAAPAAVASASKPETVVKRDVPVAAPEGAPPTVPLGRLGDLLIPLGTVSKGAVEAAVLLQQHGDGRKLGQILVQQFGVSEEEIAQALKTQEESKANPGKSSVVVDSNIRVDVGLLDKLMNLVGELVLARNQLIQGTLGQEGALIRTVQRLNLITSELQEGVLKTRMQPIGMILKKLPRVIRDLAAECGKKIHLEMEGAETELDKTIIEAIKDPLTHIVRNSCDHGIETPEVRLQKGKPAQGIVHLRAYHEGGHVNIEISDDGAGLNVEKLKARAIQRGLIRPDQAVTMSEHDAIHLVFLPGFSTAEKVTNISGRGVGMDVVKTNIQKIGGVVEISNRVGAPGSSVKIKIPLTLAIIPGLIIRANCRAEGCSEPISQKHQFVIPQANLLELLRLEDKEGAKRIEYVKGAPVYRRRGHLLPLAYLNTVLGMEGAIFPTSDVVNIVVLQAEDRPFGLVVDGISDTQEIVVKPLGARLKGLSAYLGSTIMGDGRVALILDVPGLARLAGMASRSRDAKRSESPAVESGVQVPQSFLVFQAGRFERLAVPLALVARLEQIPRTSVQRASGRSVLQYRDQILPLVTLSKLLDPDAAESISASENIQVIVFGEGARRVGVIVDEILDIVDETVTCTQSSAYVGLLGSAVIGSKITDLIDIQTLLEVAGESSLTGADTSTVPDRILIVDPSKILRALQRNFLEMRGYQILDAASVEGALEQLHTAKIDLVVTALDLGEQTGFHLLAAIKGVEALAQLPVLATMTKNAAIPSSLASAASTGALQFDAVEPVENRAALLHAIQHSLSNRPKPVAA
jgi:two-component system chemotaxis sensor kinase CheA